MSYQLETTALISKDNYNAFRIRCIMLILENIKNKIKVKFSYIIAKYSDIHSN